MRRIAYYAMFSDLVMQRDEFAVSECLNVIYNWKCIRFELLVVVEWLADNVGNVTISLLFMKTIRGHALSY